MPLAFCYYINRTFERAMDFQYKKVSALNYILIGKDLKAWLRKSEYSSVWDCYKEWNPVL